MTALILRALSRAGHAINNPFNMNGGYVVPQRGEAHRDFVRVVSDMRKVGLDLNKVATKELKKNGR